jgi:hypothetical protein
MHGTWRDDVAIGQDEAERGIHNKPRGRAAPRALCVKRSGLRHFQDDHCRHDRIQSLLPRTAGHLQAGRQIWAAAADLLDGGGSGGAWSAS